MSVPSSWQQYAIGNIGLQGDDNRVAADQKGNIWFATETDGIGKYNILTDTVSFITTTEGLESNNVKQVVIDQSGCIWAAKRFTAATFSSVAVCLQKYDPDTGMFTDHTTGDVFGTQSGLKTSWLGVETLKVNPFNGDVFAGEWRADANGYLAWWDGATWDRIPDITLGLLAESRIQFIEFETADRWWVGLPGAASFIYLVLYDYSTLTNIYSLDPVIDFGGDALQDIALLPSGRLLVVANAKIYRVDSGVPSDSGEAFNSSRGFFIDGNNFGWVSDALTESYDDSTPAIAAYADGVTGGLTSKSSGLDANGNVVLIRNDTSNEMISFGILTGPPVFNLLEVRTAIADVVDFQAILDQVGDAWVVLVPDGDPAPSAAQVKAGQDSTGTPVIAGFADTIALDMNTENAVDSFKCTGLTVGVLYDAYIVAEGWGGLQAAPTKLDVLTTQPDHPDLLPPGIIETITTGGQTEGVIIV